jgi:hypothetical protein
MKYLTLTILMLTISICGSASVVYQFSDPIVTGSIGFSYTTPTYLSGSLINFSANTTDGSFICDTSGLPNWICTSILLRTSTTIIGKSLAVTLNLQNTLYPGDAFSTDEISDTFSGADLTHTGSYKGLLLNTQFAVYGQPEDTSAVPEVSTASATGFGFGVLLLFRIRHIGVKRMAYCISISQ